MHCLNLYSQSSVDAGKIRSPLAVLKFGGSVLRDSSQLASAAKRLPR